MQSESYAASRDGSIEAHFLKWGTHARFIEEKRSDEWIIEQLKWHFLQRVSDRLEILKPATLWEEAEILGRFDENGLQGNNRCNRNEVG